MASRCGTAAASSGVRPPSAGMVTSPTPSISTNATRSGCRQAGEAGRQAAAAAGGRRRRRQALKQRRGLRRDTHRIHGAKPCLATAQGSAKTSVEGPDRQAVGDKSRAMAGGRPIARLGSAEPDHASCEHAAPATLAVWVSAAISATASAPKRVAPAPLIAPCASHAPPAPPEPYRWHYAGREPPHVPAPRGGALWRAHCRSHRRRPPPARLPCLRRCSGGVRRA